MFLTLFDFIWYNQLNKIEGNIMFELISLVVVIIVGIYLKDKIVQKRKVQFDLLSDRERLKICVNQI